MPTLSRTLRKPIGWRHWMTCEAVLSLVIARSESDEAIQNLSADTDLDCFASLAMTADTPSYPRDMKRPSFAKSSAPKTQRARRDPQVRARGRPGARCTRSPACTIKSIRVSHHRFTGTPGLPCAVVLTVYAVLSPATNSSCHRHRRIGLIETRSGRLRLRRFDTSNGCQDHTVCPSATSVVRLRRQRSLTGIHSMDCPPCDPLPAPDAAASTASQPLRK
jgi:hypothetical protein